MTLENKVRWCGLPAVLLVGAAVAGCSSGPKTIEHDRPLPGCDAVLAVVSRLGMTKPQPGPQVIKSASPEALDCSFTPPAGTALPGVGYSSVLVFRPTRDPYEGKPLAQWGAEFAKGTECDVPVVDDASVPHGSLCYTLRTAHTGSATVAGFDRGSGIRVNLQWSDLDADPAALRAETTRKADSLARELIAML